MRVYTVYYVYMYVRMHVCMYVSIKSNSVCLVLHKKRCLHY